MRNLLPRLRRIFRKEKQEFYDLHAIAQILRLIADILDRAARQHP